METLIRCHTLCLIWVYIVCLCPKKLDSRLILVMYMLTFVQGNCGDPDQTPLTANCLPYETRGEIRYMLKFLQTVETLIRCHNLGLHCLPVLKKLDSRLILVRHMLKCLQATGDPDEMLLTAILCYMK